MTTRIEEILSEKVKSCQNAFLWLQSDDGDCILWPTQDASEYEDIADEFGSGDSGGGDSVGDSGGGGDF